MSYLPSLIRGRLVSAKLSRPGCISIFLVCRLNSQTATDRLPRHCGFTMHVMWLSLLSLIACMALTSSMAPALQPGRTSTHDTFHPFCIFQTAIRPFPFAKHQEQLCGRFSHGMCALPALPMHTARSVHISCLQLQLSNNSRLTCRKANYVRTFGAFSSLVTALQRVPNEPSIIIATQDGSLKMWCMETFQQQVSIKVSSGISDFKFVSRKRAVLWHGNTAHVLSLRCMFPTLLACTSPVIMLENCHSGSILALFEVYFPTKRKLQVRERCIRTATSDM